MLGVFADLKVGLAELGLNMSVWDADINCVMPWAPACDQCRAVCGEVYRCESSTREVAERVVAQKRPATGRTPTGGGIVGVPVMRRRRLLGAVVACFPVREMADEESLARMCHHYRLDLEVIKGYARQDCRHSIDHAETFLKMLDWMLAQAQSARIAQEELATLSTNLSNTYEELSLIYRIGGAMRVTGGPDQFLQEVCDDLFKVINTPVAAMVDPHREGQTADVVVTAGHVEADKAQLCLLAAAALGPDQPDGPVVHNDFVAPRELADLPPMRNLMAVPIGTDNSRIGTLMAFNKDGEFDTVDLKLLGSIADQAGVFLANNRLYADLQELLVGVLHALTATIDAKDPYTSGHSQRVATVSRRIAVEYGLADEKVQRIYLTGLLHDIGKIGVPEAVLCKPGKLTDEEFEEIKRHPALSGKILGGIRQLEDVIPGIVAHHERLDGKGYPNRLQGDEVPLEARIVGLADGFDAMTSDRTYRAALPLDVVIKEIRTHAGTQFDPDLVKTFLSLDLRTFLNELRSPDQTVFPIEFARGQS